MLSIEFHDTSNPNHHVKPMNVDWMHFKWSARWAVNLSFSGCGQWSCVHFKKVLMSHNVNGYCTCIHKILEYHVSKLTLHINMTLSLKWEGVLILKLTIVLVCFALLLRKCWCPIQTHSHICMTLSLKLDMGTDIEIDQCLAVLH